MLQPSMQEAEPAEYEEDEVCEHCGRGGIALDAAMDAEEEAPEEEEEKDSPDKSKAAFIEALRKKGKR
jgi:hypothetical protein